MEAVSINTAFGGKQGVYTHYSDVTGCEMTFAVYLPPQAQEKSVPLLWYLSGLTCTHENAMTKGGFQAHCARLGMAICFPDTSPRGDNIADDAAYDLGQGAGFYVNATREPWAPHYQMCDYVTKELQPLVTGMLPITDAQGITGHSMGGLGALTIAMKNPAAYKSVSAFAPISNPTQSDWGRKQLSAYLGDDESTWSDYDPTLLMREYGWPGAILVDQGTDDQFLDLLKPEALSQAMVARRQAGVHRMQPGYDHSYFFVSSFAKDHVHWHAEALGAVG